MTYKTIVRVYSHARRLVGRERPTEDTWVYGLEDSPDTCTYLGSSGGFNEQLGLTATASGQPLPTSTASFSIIPSRHSPCSGHADLCFQKGSWGFRPRPSHSFLLPGILFPQASSSISPAFPSWSFKRLFLKETCPFTTQGGLLLYVLGATCAPPRSSLCDEVTIPLRWHHLSAVYTTQSRSRAHRITCFDHHDLRPNLARQAFRRVSNTRWLARHVSQEHWFSALVPRQSQFIQRFSTEGDQGLTKGTSSNAEGISVPSSAGQCCCPECCRAAHSAQVSPPP